VVIHLGHSDWVVIDCCLDSESGIPVAIDYFKKLGFPIEEVVKLVVATHWHDDHMNGLGDLFTACSRAKFVCSMALNCKEWGTLVETYRNYVQPGGSGIDELRKVMWELKRRGGASGAVAPPNFAIAKRPLLERASAPPATLTALSPSDAAVVSMQTRIQQELLPKARRRRLRVPSLSENDSSVVLSVRVGNVSVLLGADLEERGRPDLGWQVILNEHPVNGQRFEGFKIPHHGSENGFHHDQWPRLMKNNAWAALTPYNRSPKLPMASDCNRILQYTDEAYITAPPGLGKFRHTDRTVQKTMLEATLAIGEEPGKQGHVRLRRSAVEVNGAWKAELFGDALLVRQLLAQL
jgi:hypothetical protein